MTDHKHFATISEFFSNFTCCERYLDEYGYDIEKINNYDQIKEKIKVVPNIWYKADKIQPECTESAFAGKNSVQVLVQIENLNGYMFGHYNNLLEQWTVHNCPVKVVVTDWMLPKHND